VATHWSTVAITLVHSGHLRAEEPNRHLWYWYKLTNLEMSTHYLFGKSIGAMVEAIKCIRVLCAAFFSSCAVKISPNCKIAYVTVAYFVHM